VWLIQTERRADDRGFLARTYCEAAFAERGLNIRWPQCNLTHTLRRATIRGLHYQAEPKPEIKLVRCCVGAIFDVVVDVRPNSQTYGRYEGFELRADASLELYVPGGFAHGVQCLEDNSEVFYQMSEFYYPELMRGVRWDDPAVAVDWPLGNPILSERDRNLPSLSEVL